MSDLDEVRALLDEWPNGVLNPLDGSPLPRSQPFFEQAPRLLAALVNRVEQLETAIQTVLDDNETGAGGWGPDVTMVEVLRTALAAKATP